MENADVWFYIMLIVSGMNNKSLSLLLLFLLLLSLSRNSELESQRMLSVGTLFKNGHSKLKSRKTAEVLWLN